MKSLTEIRMDLLKMEELLIENGGEISEEMSNYLEITEKNLAEKVDSYKNFIDHVETAIIFYKQKEEEAYKVRKGYENLIENLKNNLKFTMETLNTNELKGIDYRYKIVASKPRVDVVDENQLNKKYIKEKITYVVDKELIKNDIDQGVTVIGARLVESYSLRNFVNKK